MRSFSSSSSTSTTTNNNHHHYHHSNASSSNGSGGGVEAVIYTTPNEYHPHHPEEMFIVAHEGMTEKWRKDKTIPLVDVVQTFDVFEHCGGGNEGEIVHSKRSHLKDVFHSDNESFIIETILIKGKIINTHTDRLHGSILGKLKPPPFRDNRIFKKPMVQSR